MSVHQSIMKATIMTDVLVRLLSIIIVIVSFVAALYRVFLGINLSDEVFAISESYITANGATPIIDTWSQAPTFVLITAPLIKLFLLFTDGSTEAIVLYGKVLYFVLKLFCTFLIYKLLRRELKIEIATILCSIILMGEYANMMTLSYCNGSMIFLLLSSIFMSNALYQCYTAKYFNRKGMLYCILSGAFECFTIVSYPSQILSFLLVVIILLFLESFNHWNHSISVSYFLSTITIGIVFIIFIVNRGGHIESLFFGIDMILHKNPYFLVSNDSGVIFFIKQLVFIGIKFIPFGIVNILALVIGRKIDTIFKRKQVHLQCLSKYYLLFYSITYVMNFIAFLIIFNQEEIWQQALTIPAVIALPLVIMCYRDTLPIQLRIIAVVMEGNALLWFLFAGITSLNAGMRFHVFVGATVTFWGLALYIFDKNFSNQFINMIAFILATVFITCCGIKLYAYHFGTGESLNELTTRVQSGPYKGLYTTKDYSDGVQEIEKIIREYTSENDEVLFLDVVPFAYLMTDAKALTPSTWDISLYGYGFNYDVQYQSYFDIKGRYPSKIIYVNTWRNECLSIDKQDYKFSDFVKNNYVLEYCDDSIIYPVRVYKRK